jgi:hypothetical protein
MLDLTKIEDLIPNILKHLSYEYHILFLKYINSDNKYILNEHRSYIFCQLLLPNNLMNFKYVLNLKQIVEPKANFNYYFHNKKLQFLLIKNNNHSIMKYIYKNYPINNKKINYIKEYPYIFEYLLKYNIISKSFMKNNYIKYVKYDINNPKYNMNSINLNIDENLFYTNKEDLPFIEIFLNYSYNLMYRLNKISYQNLIITYKKEYKYKWLKKDTLLHIKNKNEIIIKNLKELQ